MVYRSGWIAAVAVGLLSLCVCSASAQATGASATSPEATDTAGAGVEMQWAWAEVVSVDPAAQAINVKYLDYETDSEKQMTIAFDSATAFENVASASEIKPADTLSVDYVITPEGKNLAKTVTVEKTEGIMPAEEEKVKIPRADETTADTQGAGASATSPQGTGATGASPAVTPEGTPAAPGQEEPLQ